MEKTVHENIETITNKKNTESSTPNTFPFTRSGFLEGFGIPLILLLLILLFIPVRYEMNDDLKFIEILSGKGGFPHDFSSIPYLSQILNYILYFLYDWFPSIPWYGLTIYLAAYLGVSLILSVVLRNSREDFFSFFLYLPSFFIYFSYCFSVITFTSAALLLEFGVFLSLWEWVIRERLPIKQLRVYCFFLSFCFLLSFLIRWQVVLYCLLFGVPVLFFFRKQQMKSILPALIIVFVFILGDRMLFLLNTSSGHKNYIEYNELRSKFNDTIYGLYYGETTQKALKKAGWDYEDYDFYHSWLLYDERLFNSETLKLFLKENDPYQTNKLSRLIWSRLKVGFNNSKHYTLIFVFTLLALVVRRINNLANLSRKDKLKFIFSLGMIATGILFFMYYRFPPRIFVPIYAYTTVVFILMSYSKGVSQYKGILFNILILLLMLLTAGHSYSQGRINLLALENSRLEKSYIQNVLKAVEQYHPTPPLLVLMYPIHLGSIGPEKVHPLKEFSDYTTLRVFPGDGEINSPRYLSILKQMGLESSSYFLKWTINREDVLFVLFSRSNNFHDRYKSLWESYFNRRTLQYKAGV
jgi:hypothetical protein